jgi:hypothetical protein
VSPGADNYHVQPRLFLSLRDVFDYIRRHDLGLCAHSRTDTTSSASFDTNV